MPDTSADIEKKLRSLGLSRDVVQAAWPKWWSTEAEMSPSALNDLKFSLSRKLGISPGSLFDEGDAAFVWKGIAKFKGLAAQSEAEEQILANFGRALAKPLLKCIDVSPSPPPAMSPDDLRSALLGEGAPAVDLPHLLRMLSFLGIPVFYLRIMPLTAKRMTAMTVRVENRFVIFLAKDASYYAPVLYYIAHEFGHIAKAHLAENSALVDGEIENSGGDDREEQEANEYALKLLTGRASPAFDVNRFASNASELARAVEVAAGNERIDPGMLAMAYGYYTHRWEIAYGALRILCGSERPVPEEINRYTLSSLRLERLTEDSREFLLSVLGVPDEDV